jgi:O-antigen ligase
VVAAVAASAFPGVASLEGGHEVRDGAIVLVLLTLTAAAAVAVTLWAPVPDDPLPWARRLGRITTVVVCAVAAGLVLGGLAEKPSAAELARGAQAQRLASVSSNRYEYWRIGLQAFGDHPVRGLGAGGFRVEWLQHRTFSEAVRDVHSIELEQATELGLVGLAAFLTALAGALMAGRRALRRDPAAAAGACAGALVWFLHASIDWDWQLPAVSLPAIVLAGALVVLAERAADQPPRADTGSSRRLAARARSAVAGS